MLGDRFHAQMPAPKAMSEADIAPLPSTMHEQWDQTVNTTLTDAMFARPEGSFTHSGGRTGFRHTEHLGHMLAQMQVLQRSYPGAAW